MPFAAVAIFAVVILAVWWAVGRNQAQPDLPLIRLSADLGQDAVEGQFITTAISPDGNRIVFPMRQGERQLLATRRLDESKITRLPGTEGGVTPFVSPDGQWIGFFRATLSRRF